MGKIRKPGRALTRTYIRMQDPATGRSFQARVMDVRAGTDIKCSRTTIDQALKCARIQAIKRGRGRK
jgi:hypothetical protein